MINLTKSNITKSISTIGVVLVLVSIPVVPHFINREFITIKVVGKERVVVVDDGQSSSKYLVFTENETFKNTDSLLELKFSSSDIQGKLRKENIYTVKVYGIRIPFFSMYRNILSIKKGK